MSWSSELAERLDVILCRLDILARASGLRFAARDVTGFADGFHGKVGWKLEYQTGSIKI